MSDDYSQAELVRTLQRIEKAQVDTNTRLDALATSHVTRGEWVLWSDARDREIRDLKARAAPWWTWAMLIVTVVSLASNLIPRLAAGG